MDLSHFDMHFINLERGTVLPDLGKLPHFGEILPMAGDKNYEMGKFPKCSLYKGKF